MHFGPPDLVVDLPSESQLPRLAREVGLDERAVCIILTGAHCVIDPVPSFFSPSLVCSHFSSSFDGIDDPRA